MDMNLGKHAISPRGSPFLQELEVVSDDRKTPCLSCDTKEIVVTNW